MKIEFLGVGQITNDLYGAAVANSNNTHYRKWHIQPQLIAVLRISGSEKGIPNGVRPYDKTVLPYMRMLNGVNGVLQSENPGSNLQALQDAMTKIAETEKNISTGKQSLRLLPVYPTDFEAENNPNAKDHQFRLQLNQALNSKTR
jgi:hypothetical protein